MKVLFYCVSCEWQKWQQKVIRGERPATPPAEVRRQFDTWFQQEMARSIHAAAANAGVGGGGGGPMRMGSLADAAAAAGIAGLGSLGGLAGLGGLGGLAGKGGSTSPSGLLLPGEPHPLDLMSHAAGHGGFPPRVRMRTTFDPEQELPRLQRWFAENQHPTRFQVTRSLLVAGTGRGQHDLTARGGGRTSSKVHREVLRRNCRNHSNDHSNEKKANRTRNNPRVTMHCQR